MSVLDLNNPPPQHQFRIGVEREETTAERNVRLFKDVTLFLLAAGFVALMVWLCYRTVTSPTASAEEQKWAMSMLWAATGGIVGYLVRR